VEATLYSCQPWIGVRGGFQQSQILRPGIFKGRSCSPENLAIQDVHPLEITLSTKSEPKRSHESQRRRVVSKTALLSAPSENFRGLGQSPKKRRERKRSFRRTASKTDPQKIAGISLRNFRRFQLGGRVFDSSPTSQRSNRREAVGDQPRLRIPLLCVLFGRPYNAGGHESKKARCQV
jgi:hypothetical protein